MTIKINYLKCLVCVFLSFVAPISRAESLGELIQLALHSHPDIKASRFLRDASKSDIDGARWQFYPSISASNQNASVSNDNDPSYLGDNHVSTIEIVQPLWTGGLLTSNLKLAKASLDLSEAEIDHAKQDLAIRVLTSYTDWYSANMKVAAWQNSLSIHQKLSQQVRRRSLGGASSESDSALAEARVAISDADLAAAIAEEQTALTVLAELVGKPVQSSDLAQPVKLEAVLASLSIQPRNNNPLVATALAEVDIADANIRSTQAKLMPKVNLRLERQYGDFSFANSEPSNRIFIEFTMAFGAGLSSISDVSAARLRREAAVANVESQRQILGSNIASDMLLQKSIARRLTALKQSKQATENVYASFERQFLSGSRTWLDLLNSARELTQLELQIADARASSVLVSWRLFILNNGMDSILGVSF
jgi:adhesin transport system outer membrane protein